MKLFLTRYLQNRTFTHGHLHIQGFPDVFDTLELAIPRDNNSYVKHCLPPGEYPLRIESSFLALKNCYVRKPWLYFQRVKWYPNAAFLSSFNKKYPPSGSIFIGKASEDEWSINQDDMATVRFIIALSTIFDEKTNSATEPVSLIITEKPDIIVHDYSLQEYEKQQAELQERQAQQEAEELFKSPLAPKSPPAPTGGVLKDSFANLNFC